MKSDQDPWKAQFSAASKLWRDLHPNEVYRKGFTKRHQFFFRSIRTLAPGLKFETVVDALRFIRDGTWCFRMRGAICDLRVSSLMSDIVGRDQTRLSALDFDVLSASCVMNSQPEPPSPELSIQASDDEIARYLKEYCRRLDRIWNFFGGASIDNLPALAIWMIQRHQAVGTSKELSTACAAYIYGDTKLSLRILADMEAEFRERIRSGMKPNPASEQAGHLVILPNQDLVKEIATRNLGDIARLRGIIDRSHVH